MIENNINSFSLSFSYETHLIENIQPLLQVSASITFSNTFGSFYGLLMMIINAKFNYIWYIF